jgi:hypothetical protein
MASMQIVSRDGECGAEDLEICNILVKFNDRSRLSHIPNLGQSVCWAAGSKALENIWISPFCGGVFEPLDPLDMRQPRGIPARGDVA